MSLLGALQFAFTTYALAYTYHYPHAVPDLILAGFINAIGYINGIAVIYVGSKYA